MLELYIVPEKFYTERCETVFYDKNPTLTRRFVIEYYVRAARNVDDTILPPKWSQYCNLFFRFSVFHLYFSMYFRDVFVCVFVYSLCL